MKVPRQRESSSGFPRESRPRSTHVGALQRTDAGRGAAATVESTRNNLITFDADENTSQRSMIGPVNMKTAAAAAVRRRRPECGKLNQTHSVHTYTRVLALQCNGVWPPANAVLTDYSLHENHGAHECVSACRHPASLS
jgi:hypothetical protein